MTLFLNCGTTGRFQLFEYFFGLTYKLHKKASYDVVYGKRGKKRHNFCKVVLALLKIGKRFGVICE